MTGLDAKVFLFTALLFVVAPASLLTLINKVFRSDEQVSGLEELGLAVACMAILFFRSLYLQWDDNKYLDTMIGGALAPVGFFALQAFFIRIVMVLFGHEYLFKNKNNESYAAFLLYLGLAALYFFYLIPQGVRATMSRMYN